MWDFPYWAFKANELLKQTEEYKMKQLVIEQPITDLYNVDAIKKLDERIETCDWVACYVTTSGIIARLCSYKTRGNAWQVGFKYLNSTYKGHQGRLYFEGCNHIESIKSAIKKEYKVMLFNDEVEFIEWYNNNK